MDGIQKTVHEGLLFLAEKVKDGAYGIDDVAFNDPNDSDAEAFLSDMHDHVIDKMA